MTDEEIEEQYHNASAVLARIEDNTYWDDQQTLRAIDKVVEPYAHALVEMVERHGLDPAY